MRDRLDHIDGLRGLAAFLVLYQHVAEYCATMAPSASVATGQLNLLFGYLDVGKLGVVAFFAISGYIVPFSFGPQHPRLGFVASRTLEAAMIFAGVTCLLSVVTLRQAGAGAGALVIGQTLVALYDRTFLIGQSFMPAVNDLLLGFLLYQSRLVPRGLSLIGLIGGGLLISGDVAVLFGLIGQHAPATAMFAIPVALFEFSLGIWLVVKGFNTSAVKSLESQK